MSHRDQAATLRNRMDTALHEQQPVQEEVDILNLPSRSERHKKSKETKRNKNKPINWHLWFTRGIAFLFIGLLLGLIFYFSQGHWNIPTKNEQDNLKSIIR